MSETITALLIEDNPAEARLIRELLTEAGGSIHPVHVTGATNLSSALQVLSSQAVDAVLLDLNLPDSQGLETVLRVHEQNPLVPTIVLTGLADEWVALRALQSGAQDYLLKNDLTGTLLLRSLRYGIERSRSEEQLRRSEARFRHMFNSAPVGIYQSTPEGRIISANLALCRLLGYASQDELPANLAERTYIDPADRRAWREALEKSGRLVAVQKHIRRRDGALIWVEESSQVIRHDSGKTLYYEGYVQDITQRKQNEDFILSRSRQEAALADITARALSGDDLVDLLQAAAEAAARALDADFAKLFELTPSGEELLLRAGVGWSKALVGNLKVQAGRNSEVGFTLSSGRPVVVEDLATESRFLLPAFLREHGVSSGVTVVIQTRGGPYGVFGVDTREPRIFAEDEIRFLRTLANVLGTAIQRRRAEEQRENMFKRLELILKSTGEGIYTLDPDGRCTMANTAATEMLGYSSEALLGRNMHDLIHTRKADGSAHSAVRCPTLRAIHDRRGIRVIDEMFLREDGTTISVDYSSYPIVDDNVIRGAVVAFSDTTLRNQLETQLEQAHRVDSLGRVAATIAHEFNNVLMGIQPFAETLRRSAGDSRCMTAAERILESVKRGKRVTESILRFTRPAEPARQAIVIHQFVEALAIEYRAVLGGRYLLNTVSTVSLTPEVLILADPLQVQQVLSNLILNARDAMPRGGEIAMGVEPGRPGQTFSFASVAEPERFVHLWVSDRGTGIDPDNLKKIFEPLFTTKQSGTGLGLAVARQIISRNGGLIFVESAVGEGTSFHMFLPRCEPSSIPESS